MTPPSAWNPLGLRSESGWIARTAVRAPTRAAPTRPVNTVVVVVYRCARAWMGPGLVDDDDEISLGGTT
jgi:hypothetical protein